MKRKLILLLDSVEGTTDWENPDELNNFEAMGLIEMVKMQIFAQIVSDDESK